MKEKNLKIAFENIPQYLAIVKLNEKNDGISPICLTQVLKEKFLKAS